MSPKKILAFAGIAVSFTLGGCSNFLESGQDARVDVASEAFLAVPLGYSEVQSSFAGDVTPTLWLPNPKGAALGVRTMMGTMMGGGLHDSFTGALSFGQLSGDAGPFAAFRCSGSFDPATGRFECETIVRNDLTIERSVQYRDSSGAVQPSYNRETTNSVNVLTEVTGTIVFARDSGRSGPGRGFHGRILGDSSKVLSATTVVQHRSDRTVSGLAGGSTQRTVNGNSAGGEHTTGVSTRGNFTAVRQVADTTDNVVVPVRTDGPPIPKSGRIVRTMTASVTFEGQSPITAARREVIVFDGSGTAKVTITHNGVTRNCILPLPRGRLSCS
ncbi:MAG TPA: hypothetical protein VNL96_06115 [Gemmatimonadaceae bacterium]|nr:hypothetical protein [Gemmatimonadaceae bacterium]